MKLLVILIVSLCPMLAVAQQVLIPFREGNKYGLSDENGKLILKPTYDKIEYIKGKYFKAIDTLTRKDSFINASGSKRYTRNERLVYSLLHENKLLIKQHPFRYFLIYDHLIVGSANPYHPENCMLYDLKGNPLLKEMVKGLGIDDKRDFKGLVNATDKYSLLAIFQWGDDRQRLFSIAVYDHARQNISQWLVTKATDFKAIAYHETMRSLSVSYIDSNGYHEKDIRFNGNRFVLVDSPEKKSMNGGDMEYEGIIDMPVESPDMERIYTPTPQQTRKYTEEEMERLGQLYYRLHKDSLFYHRHTEQTLVQLPPGAQVIFTSKYSISSQREHMIYKQNNRFGLIIKGVTGEAVYDSLVYFGANYIASKRTGDKQRYGVLDKTAKEIIPFVYDSIKGHMPVFQFKSSGSFRDEKYSPELKDKEEVAYYSQKGAYTRYPSPFILVYSNGKSGLVNEKNEIVLPVEYDIIAENGHHFSFPSRSNFILLKKNDRYGLIPFENNLRKIEFENMVRPVFKDIPVYYINDYYGKKGFRIYGMYNEQFQFRGFASAKGILYYKD